MMLTKWQQTIVISLSLLPSIMISGMAIAQISPDSTLGLESSMVLNDVIVKGENADLITGGALRDKNLFHSFQDFNVSADQRVYFNNPNTVTNIISRVTGGNISNILGTLGVDGNADLYLINPNGIYFGENAYLDVAGSFYGSTAKQLTFEDGSTYETAGDRQSPLLTISQPLGLAAWLPAQTGTITNRGILDVGGDLVLSSHTLDLENVLFAGGDLTLQGTSSVKVRDSEVQPFMAIAGRDLTIQSDLIDLFALNHDDAGLFSGGDMILKSPNPIIMDTYFNSDGDFRLENLDGGLGNGISPTDPIIRSKGDVTFNTYSGASLHIFAAGSVTVTSITITRSDTRTTTINGTTVPLGYREAGIKLTDRNSSTLDIDGINNLTLDIRAGIQANNNLLGSTPISFSGGSAPTATLTQPITGIYVDFLNQNSRTTTLNAQRVNPINGNSITGTNTLSPPSNSNLGKITIASITINPINNIEASKGTQIYLSNQFDPIGDINANDENITINTITINSVSDPTSKVLVVDSKDNINIDSVIKNDNLSLIGISNSGAIHLIAEDNIIFGANARISTKSSSGLTGNLILEASNILLNTPSLLIPSPLSNYSLSPVIDSFGNVEIYTNQLTAYGGAQIQASTSDSRNAGNIYVNAETISFDGIISTGGFSGLSSIVDNGASGNGGMIKVTANNLSLTNGAQIKNSTSGAGNAGIIDLDITNSLTIDGAQQSPTQPTELAVSGIFSEVLPSGTGSGQAIKIKTKDLSVTNGGNISAATAGVGNAGDLEVIATGTALFDGVKSINGNLRRSGAFASSRSIAGSPTSVGEGGQLTLNAANLSITNGAALEALTETSAKAGNVTVQVSENINIAGTNSGIFADTTEGSGGAGGSIKTTSQNLFVTNGGAISASTAGAGHSGDVVISTAKIASFDGISSGVFTESKATASGAGGSLTVDTADLAISNGAQLKARTASSQNAGNIVISATRNINIAGTNAGIFADTTEGSGGAGGSIKTTSQNLFVTNGGAISASTAGAGRSGDVVINTAETASFDGISSGVFTESKATAFGAGGSLTVNAADLEINNGAQLRATTASNFDAGNIKINVTGDINITGENTGIFADTTEGSGGDGGSITTTSQNLFVTNGGVISASTAGAGHSGDVVISTAETASFDGISSGVFTESKATASGSGGNVTVNAADLAISNGAQLKARTASSQNAGNIVISATRNINIAGTNAGIFADTTEGSGGDGGSITTTSQNLFAINGGAISASTAGAGRSGDVVISTAETASFDGISSGVFTESKATAFGAGGSLTVNAADLEINNGAQLKATTASDFDAGNIKINVTGDINISGENTGIFANTTESSNGNGGSISIDPINIRLSNGGGFFVNSLGTGRGGDIYVVSDYLLLDKGFISAETASNLGGNIVLNIGELITFVNGSAIAATAGTVRAGGDGGNISIKSPFILAFPDQMNYITANAFTGKGGNIDISTNAILGANYLTISASSQFGLDGSIVINDLDVDPASGLAKLSTDFTDSDDTVVQSCASSELNSYTITGRGGLAEDPSTTLRGRSVLADLRDFSQGSSEQQTILESVNIDNSSVVEQATNLTVNNKNEPQLIVSHTYEFQENQSFNCY